MSKYPGSRFFPLLAGLVAVLAFALSPMRGALARDLPTGTLPPTMQRAVARMVALLPPSISASKRDALLTDADGNGQPSPGDTLRYTVVISNTGDADALGTVFTDTVGANTTFVAGSTKTSPLARNDGIYTAIGNVRIQVPDGANDLLANDTDLDGGSLTISAFPATSANGGNITVNTTTGAFTYNPAPGYEGTDTFTYTVQDDEGQTNTATVTITVAKVVWFVNPTAGAGGDGRLTSPFNCFVNAGTGCFDDTALDQAGDAIFLYSGNHTGGHTLLANQLLIGQGASASLATILSLTVPPFSDALPATGGANPVITTTVAATNGLNLSTGNTLRGFTVGDTTGIDINGNAFGTLTLSEVTLDGTGRALSLVNGTVTATFASITSTSSTGGEGLLLNQVSGTLTVSGATSITNPASTGITIQNSGATVTFAATTVNKGGTTGTGVSLTSNSGTTTFATLSITTSNGSGLVGTNNPGAINVTTAAGSSISTTGGPAVNISNASGTPSINLNFTTLSSTNSTATGITLDRVSGTGLTSGTTTVTNPTGSGLSVANSSAPFNFGNTNVSGSGNANNDANGMGVFLNANSGAITFADLDIAPDSGERALHATSNTGMITTASGTVSATNAIAVEIVGQAAATRTPIRVVLTSVSALASGGNPANGIVLTNTSAPTASTDGFRVVGNGGTCTFATPTCTGGRIQNTTGGGDTTAEDNPGIGVRLFNAQQVFLTRMRIDNHSNFAIFGRNVVGFNLDASVIDGLNGDSAAHDEASIYFFELTGTTGAGTASNITNSFIGGGREFLLKVDNFATGTLDRLTINNNTIGDLDGAGPGIGLHQTDGDDALSFNSTAAGSTLNVTVTNNVINVGRGDIVNYNVGNGGSHTSNFVLRGNTMHNTHPQIVSGGGGVTVTFGGPTTHSATYDISCNSTRFALGHSLLVAKAGTGGGTVQGTIFNNRIGVDGVAGSSSSQASGMNVDTRGGGTHTVLIKNNQVHEWGANGAIQIFNNQGSSTMNVTVQGNLSNNPPSQGLAGLYAEVGALSGDTNVLNLLVGGAGANENNFVEGDPFNSSDVLLSRIAGGGTTFNLSRGVSGASSVQQIITDNNVDPVTALGAGTINFVNTTPALPPVIDQSCAAPVSAGVAQVNPNSPGTLPAATSAAGEPAGAAEAPNARDGDEAPTADASTVPAPAFVPVDLTLAAREQGDALEAAEVAPATPEARAPESGVGGDVALSAGTLNAGERLTITFSVTVNNPLPAGVASVQNQGRVTGSNFSPVLTNDPDTGTANDPTVTVILAQPDFRLTKSDGGASFVPGGTIVYTLAYTNTGNQGATGVTLNEVVPANTTFNLTASGAGWSCANGAPAGTICTRTVGALAGGGVTGSATFAVTVVNPLAATVTAITNNASVNDDASNGADPTPADNTGADTTPIGGAAFFAAPDAATCGATVPCLFGPTSVQAALNATTSGGTVTVLGIHNTATPLTSGGSGGNAITLTGVTAGTSTIRWTGAAGSLFTIGAGNVTIKGLELTCAGSDCANTTAFNHTGAGTLLAYANDVTAFGLGYSNTGGGTRNLRHNWWGSTATPASVGDSAGFDFRLGAAVARWSDGGTLPDSGNGRNAAIAPQTGTGTGVLVSHGRGVANAPFGKADAVRVPCSDFYDAFVVNGSAGSTWDVTIPVDSTPIGCETNTAGGTPATNVVYLFDLTPAGAPNTACTLNCWDKYPNSTRNGAPGSYSLTAQDVAITDLGSTPIVAGDPQGSAPTAVLLAAFGATPQEAAIQVRWETVAEQDTLGFNLLRATAPDAEPTRLNPQLIPSQGPGGAAYDWTDADVAAGTTYFYWLESVSTDGKTARFGPVSATAQTSSAVTLGTLSTTPGLGGTWGWALAALGLTLGAGLWHRRRTAR